MITVICTQCRAHLEMDEAFAGGVCRCQHCGTIQTVPPMSKLRPRQPAPAAVAAAPPGNGAASQARGAVAPRPHGAALPSDDGLDALAEAVASSSGLGRSSLRAGPGTAGTATATAPAPAAAAAATFVSPAIPVDYARPAPVQRRNGLVLLALAAVTVLAQFLMGMMFFSTRLTVQTAATRVPTAVPAFPTNPGNGGDGPKVVIPQYPHFCGVSLDGVPSVVYVLDRGQATGVLFDTLKEATYRSVESLKPGQKFAIVFWSNSDDQAAYPPGGGLCPATPAEIQAAKEQFAEVYAGGRAEARPAIEWAAALKPSVIVLVTGKAFSLEPDLMDATQQAIANAGGQTKVHTIALDNDDGNTVLRDIAKTTGGESKVVSKNELRQYSD